MSNGVGLDDFLDDLLGRPAARQPHLVLGEGIPAMTVDGQTNPHFWLDPTLVKQYYLPAIAARYPSSTRPARRLTMRTSRVVRCPARSSMRSQGGDRTIPEANRKLVTFHDAFPYFARHYGFELVGVILENPGQEPSAADLAALVEKVRAAGVKAVFSEAQFNPKLAETLARRRGSRRSSRPSTTTRWVRPRPTRTSA